MVHVLGCSMKCKFLICVFVTFYLNNDKMYANEQPRDLACVLTSYI